mgnify:FL=1
MLFRSVPERVQLWESHLPDDLAVSEDLDLRQLASRYPLTGRHIRNAVDLAAGLWRAERRADPMPVDRLATAADMQLRADLAGFAEERAASHRLEDVVLPDEQAAQLQEVRQACAVHARVMTAWGFGRALSKGRGLGILFDGEPGTGKTHAAEALASELSLRLFQVSIPRIVSKWVGETEKNIAAIFRQARHANALLLFDEADALFSARTEVETSNDRHANMEINSLLQEIEHYDGVTVLTTNLKRNLDRAVERRIAFRIAFPFPDAALRARLWERLVPREAPLAGDVRFAELAARYELSGGHIKNAVLRAAYRAMSDGGPIAMRHLSQAAALEARNLGRLVRD